MSDDYSLARETRTITFLFVRFFFLARTVFSTVSVFLSSPEPPGTAS